MNIKKLGFWNPATRQYARIETHTRPGVTAFYIIYDGDKTYYEQKTFGAAVDKLKKAGFEEMGFLDSTGARRYTMTLAELQALYKRMEDFIADCTQSEYNENKAAIIAVFSLIHKHINAETFK